MSSASPDIAVIEGTRVCCAHIQSFDSCQFCICHKCIGFCSGEDSLPCRIFTVSRHASFKLLCFCLSDEAGSVTFSRVSTRLVDRKYGRILPNRPCKREWLEVQMAERNDLWRRSSRCRRNCGGLFLRGVAPFLHQANNPIHKEQQFGEFHYIKG
jgi:hypothetical protein